MVVVVAASERAFELAGKCLGQRMSHRKPNEGRQVGSGVEDLRCADPCSGRSDHVAHHVSAGLPGAQAGSPQQSEGVWALVQGDVVELEVLSRGDVALAKGSKLLTEFAQNIHGLGGDDAAGNLHANHLDIGLALAVDTLLQTEGCEFRVFPFAGHECRRLFLQPHYLVFHEGNYGLSILG